MKFKSTEYCQSSNCWLALLLLLLLLLKPGAHCCIVLIFWADRPDKWHLPAFACCSPWVQTLLVVWLTGCLVDKSLVCIAYAAFVSFSCCCFCYCFFKPLYCHYSLLATLAAGGRSFILTFCPTAVCLPLCPSNVIVVNSGPEGDTSV